MAKSVYYNTGDQFTLPKGGFVYKGSVKNKTTGTNVAHHIEASNNYFEV